MSRLKNIGYLIACIIRFFIFGKADKYIQSPKRAMIIQMAKFGDMICTTPMFRAIKEQYPDCILHVMGNAINEQVIEGNPDINQYVVSSKKMSNIREDIESKNLDFACVTSPDFFHLAALYLSGVPTIVTPDIVNGFSPYETRPYKLLKRFVISSEHKMKNYAGREYLKLLEPIGITSSSVKKYVYSSDQAGRTVDSYLQKQNVTSETLVVGIAPSAGNKIKVWPGERFAQIAEYLRERHNATVIVIAAKADHHDVDSMMSELKSKQSIINTLDIFSIDELKYLVGKLNIFISADTGPIYIAEALGVPTIDIVGPVDENEQPPQGAIHKIVVADRAKPELYVMNARQYDRAEALRQVRDITVDMVKEKIDELIESMKRHG